MKALPLFLGFFLVVSSAHAQFSLTPEPTADIICTLKRASGSLPNSGGPLFPCASSGSKYQLAFANTQANFKKALQEGSNLHIRLHCTTKVPNGIFVYGGETIGFDPEKRQKFFYAVGKGAYGRCFIGADKALMNNITFDQNQSAILLTAVKDAPVALK